MLKFKITKSAFDKLSDEMKAFYTENEDAKGYTLEVSGLPEPEDAGELKRALERVRADLKDAEKERDEFEAKITAAEKNQSEGDRDVKRLQARYEAKMAALKTEGDAKVETLTGYIRTTMINGAADALAGKISTVPKLMADHIKGRLTVEFPDDGEPVLKVLKDGKASDLTIDKLSEELVANKDFSGIIIGSRARGGGTSPDRQAPNSGSATQDQPTDLYKMPAKDFAAHIKSVREASAAT